jgi:hypothetical protein
MRYVPFVGVNCQSERFDHLVTGELRFSAGVEEDEKEIV